VGALLLGWGASIAFVTASASRAAVRRFCALNVLPMALVTKVGAQRQGVLGLVFHLQAMATTLCAYVSLVAPSPSGRRRAADAAAPRVKLPPRTTVFLA